MAYKNRKDSSVPETSPLRVKSILDRSARNTSASSRSSTQPQRLARLKDVSRAFSTSPAVVPKSPKARDKPVSVLKMPQLEDHVTYHTLSDIEAFQTSGLPPLWKFVSKDNRHAHLCVRKSFLPAVVVFPTPGAPCKRIISPFPILKSATILASHERTLTFAADDIGLTFIL
jgi:hypothetical protein